MPLVYNSVVLVEPVDLYIVAVHKNVSEEKAAPDSIVFHADIPFQFINVTLLVINKERIQELGSEFIDFCPNTSIFFQLLLGKLLNINICTVVAFVKYKKFPYLRE